MEKMSFWITHKDGPRPAFCDVVNVLFGQYKRHRGNIVGKTLQAPDGSTARQLTLALTRVREMYAKEKRKP